MNMEKVVYESQPLIYIGSGVLTILLIQTPLKMLPAFLLIGAGLLVMAWRHGARSQARRRAAHARRVRSLDAWALERSHRI